MQSFSELLKQYTERTGISDAELARAVGVRRQTVFRWKEGTVARPRSRDDVLAVSQKLRLLPDEADQLLIAAGFHPQGEMPSAITQPAPAEMTGETSPRAALPQRFPAFDDDTDSVPTLDPPAGFTRLRWFGFGLAIVLALGLIAAIWWARQPPLPVAAPGETLVIVGQFTNFTGGEIGFNVAGRIADPLRQEIENAGLTAVRVVVWPESIRSETEAQAILARSAAWMIIWGEYDSGRVLARFAQSGAGAPPPVESLVASPDDLFATINSDLPQEVRYLALLTLGALYTDQNDFALARAVLTRAYATPPQERDALSTLLFRLGLTHQLGDDPQPATAIDYYSELLELAPDHLLARYNRGLAYLARSQAGDWEQALADFDGVIRRSPSFLGAYIGRGVVHLYRRGDGDEEAAQRDFSYVIERDDQRTMAYYNRGLLAIRTDNRLLWESDLRRVVELAPAFASGYSALCWGYVLEDAPEDALPICDQAVALGAQEALHSRGMAHAQTGDFALAGQDLRAFLGWLDQQPPASPYLIYKTQAEEWLAALDRGVNPLTPELLAKLRRE